MSKAFTKESDAEDELPEADEPLPGGFKNYMTPAGYRTLEAEFRQLVKIERPKVVEIVSWAAGNGDRSENGDYIYGKKRLREIDKRIRFLQKRMESAVVVDQSLQKMRDRVFFGATVTFVNERDEERTVRIVGIDEASLEKGAVSWISPIAKALHKAKVGDVVNLRTPQGMEEIEVLKIAYIE